METVTTIKEIEKILKANPPTIWAERMLVDVDLLPKIHEKFDKDYAVGVREHTKTATKAHIYFKVKGAV